MASNEDVEGTDILQGVYRSHRILETLHERKRAGVTKIAEVLDIPTSTAHVHLATLRECGYVVQEGTTYRLSLKFFEYGGATRYDLPIYAEGNRILDDVPEQVGELANLGIEERGQRVIVYKAFTEESVNTDSPHGHHSPIHASALGKAILAHRPRAEVQQLVETHGLPACTEHTITDESALYAELDQIRDRGYALENEELFTGIQAVGLPILDSDGYPVAGIDSSGPKVRIEHKLEDNLLEVLREARNSLEIRYQYYQEEEQDAK